MSTCTMPSRLTCVCCAWVLQISRVAAASRGTAAAITSRRPAATPANVTVAAHPVEEGAGGGSRWRAIAVPPTLRSASGICWVCQDMAACWAADHFMYLSDLALGMSEMHADFPATLVHVQQQLSCNATTSEHHLLVPLATWGCRPVNRSDHGTNAANGTDGTQAGARRPPSLQPGHASSDASPIRRLLLHADCAVWCTSRQPGSARPSFSAAALGAACDTAVKS
jgi:hypothetical protein